MVVLGPGLALVLTGMGFLVFVPLVLRVMWSRVAQGLANKDDHIASYAHFIILLTISLVMNLVAGVCAASPDAGGAIAAMPFWRLS